MRAAIRYLCELWEELREIWRFVMHGSGWP
jgi:hypothetical protein